jgi:hypothetical protein
MNKITYHLLVLLALIFAGCSGNNSTSSDGDSSTTMSSSISVIPDMSSPASSSSVVEQPATSSTGTSSGGTSVVGTSSETQVSSGSSSSTVVASNSPISLYKMGGLAKKTIDVTNTMSAIPYNVDLDTIYGTSGFSFLIKNNGTSDITGLKFEFDLDYFKVTPDSIITLGAPSTSTGIEQLIKVTVEHGTLASGYGFTNVLTGNQYGTLTITGKNANGDFSVTYTMHVYAKRMIITIDVPDTIRLVNDWFTTQAGTSALTTYQKSYRYAHVDPSSEDCYLNMGELTLDTSTNLAMPDMKDYYKTFYKKDDLNITYDPNGLGNVLFDSSATGIATHLKFFNELNGAKRLETYNYMDNNCVVLVNDNWPTTTTGAGNLIATQRILD